MTTEGARTVETTQHSATLLERYRRVRAATDALSSRLSAEDQTVSSMPDVSPTKWHRAHTTWFFETFLLTELPGYTPYDENFGYLFNSYYEAVGERHARDQRGVVTRPGIAEIGAYRLHVDEAMTTLVEAIVPERPDLATLVTLGLHHEQQHQELLLMDIKHVFSSTILKPAYHHIDGPVPPTPSQTPSAMGWVDFDGGLIEVGAGEAGADSFFFDNEGPRHRTFLEPFRLADRLVTCGEWINFIADGGYQRSGLWLSEGWHTIADQDWTAPLYWRRGDDGWRVHTLAGERPVDPAEPVCHVSLFEADAYATWAGARLPTEFEWEHASQSVSVAGNFAEDGLLHPRPAPPADGSLRQMFGDVWEWTSSPYTPYPRFAPAPGAVGEYNGKFMANQMVLRGGACVTPADHVRATYRNFFPTAARWPFTGLRLAAYRN